MLNVLGPVGSLAAITVGLLLAVVLASLVTNWIGRRLGWPRGDEPGAGAAPEVRGATIGIVTAVVAFGLGALLIPLLGQQQDAASAVRDEAASLRVLDRELALGASPTERARIEDLMRDYVDAADEEWDQLAAGDGGSPVADPAAARIQAEVARLGGGERLEELYTRFERDRYTRIASASRGLPSTLWAAVMALAFLSLWSLTWIPIERAAARRHRWALISGATLTVSLLLLVILLLQNPFQPPLYASPDPIRAIL